MSEARSWIDRIARRLARWRSRGPGATWVVAVSGGGDSVGLLRVLHQLAPAAGLRLSVAHLDHGAGASRRERTPRSSPSWRSRSGCPSTSADGSRGAPATSRPMRERPGTSGWSRSLDRAGRGPWPSATRATTRPRRSCTASSAAPARAGWRGCRGRGRCPRTPRSSSCARCSMSRTSRSGTTSRSWLSPAARMRRTPIPHGPAPDPTRPPAQAGRRVQPEGRRGPGPARGARRGVPARDRGRRAQDDGGGHHHPPAALPGAQARVLTLAPLFPPSRSPPHAPGGVRGWPEAGMSARRWRRLAALVRNNEVPRTDVGAGVAVSTESYFLVLHRSPVAPVIHAAPDPAEPIALAVPGSASVPWAGGRVVATVHPGEPGDESIDFDRLALPLVVRARRRGIGSRRWGWAEEHAPGRLLPRARRPARSAGPHPARLRPGRHRLGRRASDRRARQGDRGDANRTVRNELG